MSQTFGVTEYPNTFKRQGAFPLDKFSVFSSLSSAIEYAKSNSIAYEGQIISVVENDTVTAYTLKKSAESDVNYELTLISASSNDSDVSVDLTNVTNDINNKIGVWTISEKSDTGASLDFDLMYPIEADSYEVYFNDESVSEVLSLADEFVTDLEVVTNDSNNITIKFYNNSVPIFNVEARVLYKNNIVVLGSLYLKEFYDTTIS